MQKKCVKNIYINPVKSMKNKLNASIFKSSEDYLEIISKEEIVMCCPTFFDESIQMIHAQKQICI